MGVSLLIRLLEGQRVDALRIELSTRLVVREIDGASAAVDRAPRDRRGRSSPSALRSVRRSRSGGGPRNAYDVQRLVSDRHGHASHADPRSSTRGASPRARPGRGGRRTRRARRARCTRAPDASSCSRCASPAGRPVSPGTRASSFPSRAAASPIRRASSTRVRTGSCARGRRPCRGGWSTQSEVVVDEGREAAVFRGVAIAGGRVYATDFHNARVDVYDGHWHRVGRPGAFVDASIPVLVRAVRHPGDRRPPVRHVRLSRAGERQRRSDRRLRRRVRPRRAAGRAGRARGRAQRAVGPRARAALVRPVRRRPAVGNFGDGRINAFRRASRRLVVRRHAERPARQAARPQRPLGARVRERRHGGPAGTLFFTSGPHTWHGDTELGVHGLLGSISPA